jgi:hypothetical protein
MRLGRAFTAFEGMNEVARLARAATDAGRRATE